MLGMINTLNSFYLNQIDSPSEPISRLPVFNDFDDIKTVADFLDDMTRDDDMADEFFEVINPNIVISRSIAEQQTQSSG